MNMAIFTNYFFFILSNITSLLKLVALILIIMCCLKYLKNK